MAPPAADVGRAEVWLGSVQVTEGGSGAGGAAGLEEEELLLFAKAASAAAAGTELRKVCNSAGEAAAKAWL